MTGHNTGFLFHSDLISALFNYFIDFTIRKNSTWMSRSHTWCRKKIKLTSFMNMAGKVFHKKYYENKTDKEKVDS